MIMNYADLLKYGSIGRTHFNGFAIQLEWDFTCFFKQLFSEKISHFHFTNLAFQLNREIKLMFYACLVITLENDEYDQFLIQEKLSNLKSRNPVVFGNVHPAYEALLPAKSSLPSFCAIEIWPL
jgi:hypothetical protein